MHKEDQRKPQEITEDDITRSANETTKNVANVRLFCLPPFAFLPLIFSCSHSRTRTTLAREDPRELRHRSEPLQIHHQPARFRAVGREPVLPFVPHKRRQSCIGNRGQRTVRLYVFLLAPRRSWLTLDRHLCAAYRARLRRRPEEEPAGHTA